MQRIAQVQVGNLTVFMLEDDFQFSKFAAGGGILPEIWPFDVVFDHHVATELDFAVLDVGAKYGVGAIQLARWLDVRGREIPIHAFEPGIARAALQTTLAFNGYSERIVVREIAVSDSEGSTVMYGDAQHPEDNHIVKRNLPQPLAGVECITTSLDAYCDQEGLTPPLVVKIDTQGAEWEVWKGMQRLIGNGPVTFLTEFTPWTFDGRADPSEFLREISRTHELIDIRPKNMAGSFIDSGVVEHLSMRTIEAFEARVRGSQQGWTDVLCIPRSLPGWHALTERVLSISKRR